MEIISVQNMVTHHCARVKRELLKLIARPDAPKDAAHAVMQGFAQHVRNEREVWVCRCTNVVNGTVLFPLPSILLFLIFIVAYNV